MIPALLKSRKFWLTVIGIVAAIVSYARGGITAEHLSDVITLGIGALIVMIGIEDAASKSGVKTQTAGGDITNVAPVVTPQEAPTRPNVAALDKDTPVPTTRPEHP